MERGERKDAEILSIYTVASQLQFFATHERRCLASGNPKALKLKLIPPEMFLTMNTHLPCFMTIFIIKLNNRKEVFVVICETGKPAGLWMVVVESGGKQFREFTSMRRNDRENKFMGKGKSLAAMAPQDSWGSCEGN
jgi:hypothetical protein